MSFGSELPDSVYHMVVPEELQPAHLAPLSNGGRNMFPFNTANKLVKDLFPSIAFSSRTQEIPHPFDIAQEFAEKLITPPIVLNEDGEELRDVVTFYIRPDSYIDKGTGIAHVYLRQRVFGLGVANGDINVNVNVQDGRILSYGASVSSTVLCAICFTDDRRSTLY